MQKSGRKSNKKLLETGFALGALKIAASLVGRLFVEFVKNRLIGMAGQSAPIKKAVNSF